MDNIKAKVAEAFTALGYQGEELETTVNSLFNDETPELDTEAFLTKAQDYAKPFIAENIEKEKSLHWKGQYTNDFLGQVAKASKGLFTRREVEGKSAEELFALFQQKMQTTTDAAELQEMVNALNAEKETWEETTTTRITEEVGKVRNEYATREQQRTNFDKMLSTLGKKNVAKEVDKVEAAEMLLTKMQTKYDLAWNAQKDTFDVFEKGTQNLAKKNGTALVEFDKELEADLKKLNWVAVSNGGTGGGQPLPPPDPNKRQSSLGAALERSGVYNK